MSLYVIPRRHILAAGLGFPSVLLAQERKGPETGQEKPIGAAEDLMREHGILRRILLVYAETAPTIAKAGSSLDVGALHAAAKLFRSFGEDYHEKKLEEDNVFPALRTAEPSMAGLIRTLAGQHEKGRQITDHILGATAGGKIGSNLAEPLAAQMRALVRMYQNHTAREDTIVFPAWKRTLSQPKLDALSEKFEGIEKQTFGTDGFEDAARQIADIEQRLGLADLDHFTASAPTLP